jgi:hypothetical protein
MPFHNLTTKDLQILEEIGFDLDLGFEFKVVFVKI